ncbi:hypothetical protein BC628DRAFT_1505735 [Trametes gibbosa]|nr:hypothetical protein BC628DRAFT_1505735 [Trametes gibbosa]
MTFSTRLLAILAVTPLLAQRVLAGGVIACYTSHISGGVGNIPVHNPEFYDGHDTYIGGPFAEACGEMVGMPGDDYSNWEGNGESISAKFWITSNSCMNVMTGGVHYWCCTNGIGENDGSVTTCNYT